MPKREDVILQAIDNLHREVVSTNVRLDHTNDRLNSVDKTLAKQEVNIETHVKRSESNERMVEQNKKESDAKIDALKKEVEPIKRHVVMLEGILKGIGFLAVVVGIGAGLAEIVMAVAHFFHH